VPSFETTELWDHFYRHGRDFGAATDTEYEMLAATFLTAAHHPNLMECTRKYGGDLVRYDRVTQEYGVLSIAGVIRTYFKPVPCGPAVLLSPPDCHNDGSNIQYFRKRCV
jgi:pyocin large subunit-like protein